jgi:hypothetical protein
VTRFHGEEKRRWVSADSICIREPPGSVVQCLQVCFWGENTITARVLGFGFLGLGSRTARVLGYFEGDLLPGLGT